MNIHASFARYHSEMIVRIVLLVVFLCAPQALSQDPAGTASGQQSDALRVFMDCTHCDLEYVRSEIIFVNYVRDRAEAELHILVTTEHAGNGGIAYTFDFIGQQKYAGVNDTLKYVSKNSDTQEIVRAGFVRSLKLGLIRYVERTPFGNDLAITYKAPVKPDNIRDAWDSWVFSVNVNGSFYGEQQQSSHFLSGGLSANRTTEDLKLSFSGRANNREEEYHIDDTTQVTNISRSSMFEGLAVISLTDHWSIGGSIEISASTYSNRKILFDPAMGLEYNLFPYSESTRRQLRCAYEVHYNYVEYNEETIYFRNVERRGNEKVSVTLELKEPWGTASASLEGSHYFHDVNKNRIELSAESSYRLVEGLSIRLSGSVSRIHDQLSLPAGEVSIEDRFLRQQQLATQYEYSTSIGISYSFGSIYNNVVNGRFGL